MPGQPSFLSVLKAKYVIDFILLGFFPLLDQRIVVQKFAHGVLIRGFLSQQGILLWLVSFNPFDDSMG